jgi:flagellar hook assembly protein FlgD
LVDGKVKAGAHSILWDGRDGFGKEVGSGVYVVRMEAKDFIEVRKMVLIR